MFRNLLGAEGEGAGVEGGVKMERVMMKGGKGGEACGAVR